MKEVTIVTAFFDIGRGNWGHGFTRSEQDYLRYFGYWARMKNNLVVFTEERFKDEVMRIRAQHGLADKTRVVVVDLDSVDPELLATIEEVLSHPEAVAARKQPQNPECWNARYDYVMCLKPILIQKAIEEGWASGMVAWFDFGYLHGAETFARPEDFDFTWETNLPDKVNLFFLKEDYDRPIEEIVRDMELYIMGATILAPSELWPEVAKLLRGAAMELASRGMADDDQTLFLMAFRKKKEIFNAVPIVTSEAPLFIATGRQFELSPGASLGVRRTPHKMAKRSMSYAWHTGNYGKALWHGCKYFMLKLSGK